MTKLSVIDSQTRFKQVFVNLIVAMATPKHPLVIFIDDLQWADSTTLTVLTTLLTTPGVRHLLLLGAYRDNEVNETHPFARAMREVREKDGCIQDLTLNPLTLPDVTSLIHDTFTVNHEVSACLRAQESATGLAAVGIHTYQRELAKVVFKKTEGNPFFINQLLNIMYQDSNISLRANPMPHWVCDMEKLKEVSCTNNVIDLMVNKIRRTPEMQTVLGIAAQIGTQFELHLLSHVCQLTLIQTMSLLRVPIQESFIVVIENEFDGVNFAASVQGDLIPTPKKVGLEAECLGYTIGRDAQGVIPEEGEDLANACADANMLFRFGHDRIQQASASLVAKEDIPKIHFRIAEYLIARLQGQPKQMEDMMWFIVNHLNSGYELSKLEPPSPLHDGNFLPLRTTSISKLNLLAATKSKNATAYAQALVYVDEGLYILQKWEDTSWEKCYEVIFALYCMKAEMLCLKEAYEEADAIYPLLLLKARTRGDKCTVYFIMYSQYELQCRFHEIIDLSWLGLDLLGVVLPRHHDELLQAYKTNLEDTLNLLGPNGAKTLIDLPLCEDLTTQAIMKVLYTMYVASFYLGQSALENMLSSHLVVLSIRKGVCEDSLTGFTSLGAKLGPGDMGPVCGNYTIGYELSRAALVLADTHYPQTRTRGRTYIIYSFCHAWCAPVSACLGYLTAGYEICRQTGDLAWTSYSVPYIIEFPFFAGRFLGECSRLYDKYQPSVKNNKVRYYYLLASSQPIRDLMGNSFHFLQGESYEGSLYETELLLNMAYFYANAISSYYMKQRRHWLTYADKAIIPTSKRFPALYKRVEARTIVPLIYLDWLSRSPLVREIYGANKRATSSSFSSKFELDMSDIDNERHLSRNEQLELLHARLITIEESTNELAHYAAAHEGNYLHKLLLLRAERARLALILGSTAVFCEHTGNIPAQAMSLAPLCTQAQPSSAKPKPTPQKQDFEAAMELYECAIQSAREHGFMQYEALALELYGLFWLTGPNLPKEQVASGYLMEAIFVYERWGAPAKAQQVRAEYAAVMVAGGRYELSNMEALKSKIPTITYAVFSPDLETVVQASQTISNEVDMCQLIRKMIKVIVENSGAQRGTLFMVEEDTGQLTISATYTDKEKVKQIPEQGEQKNGSMESEEGGAAVEVYTNGRPVEEWEQGPLSIVNFSRRTLLPTMLPCAMNDAQFGLDPYIVKNHVKSVLGMPILLKGALKGVLYLENNLCEGLFTKHRMDLLLVLTSQMAITLENARFFNTQMKEQIAKLRFEQLTHDEERQRMRADAAEKYRLQLENFMDMICHEIRNPLNGIFGNADLIFCYLESLESLLITAKIDRGEAGGDIFVAETELRNFLEQIKISAGSVQICAEHQKCITDDVLQLSKLRANKLQLNGSFFLPSELSNNIVRMFSVQAANKGLELTLNLPEGKFKTTELYADPVRITQIVTNIMSNAVKFTKAGSINITVVIEENLMNEYELYKLHNMDEEDIASEKAEHYSTKLEICDTNTKSKVPYSGGVGNEGEKEMVQGRQVQNCYLKVKVADTGIGMTAEEQARIFTRFSQANNRTSTEYGGSGLGLSICKILAKLMHGYLYVESTKGVGSTFYLSILCKRLIASHEYDSVDPTPKVELPAPLLSPSAAHVVPPSDILVVEDNLMNQLLLSRILKIRGYTVHVANNGLEGFEKYKEQPHAFQHILMDIQMPIMDGLESTMKIRKFEKQEGIRSTCIIGLSGNARDEYKEQAFTAGMNEYITKPYHKEVLFSLLDRE